MSTVKDLRSYLERRKGRAEQIADELRDSRVAVKRYKKAVMNSRKAQTVIHEAAKDTQGKLKVRLSDLVSMGMSAVFPDPYSLGVDFKSSRGKVEAFLSFERGGHTIKTPTNGAGLGAVDIAAANLRMSAWALSSPRPRNTLILDEPFKHLKGAEYPEKAALMLREVSAKLGLQIIMISHDPELIEGADNVIRVRQNRTTGQSKIVSS